MIASGQAAQNFRGRRDTGGSTEKRQYDPELSQEVFRFRDEHTSGRSKGEPESDQDDCKARRAA